MAVQWGPWVGTSPKQARAGIEFLSVSAASSESTSVTVKGRVWWQGNYPMTDTSNDASWSGIANGSAYYSASSPNLSTTTQWQQKVLFDFSGPATVVFGAKGTATQKFSVKGIEYIGSSLTVSVTGTVELPARPYRKPISPAASEVSLSTDFTSWFTNKSDPSNGRPWSRVEIERMDNVATAWKALAIAAGSAGYYRDQSIFDDRLFTYRIRPVAVNLDGSTVPGDWVTTGSRYTRPAAPTDATVTKKATDALVAWKSSSTIVSVFEIQDAPGGTWGAITSNIGKTLREWTFTAPDPTVTHAYRVRTKAPDGQVSEWTLPTSTVQLLARPGAPTGLTPTGAWMDAQREIKLDWLFNSLDGTEQTQYELELQADTEATPTTFSGTGSLSEQAVAGGSLIQGTGYSWRVRAKGQHVDWSDWSALAKFYTAPPPTFTIVGPVEGQDFNSNRMAVSWEWYSPSGQAQASWWVKLYDAQMNLLETTAGNGPATSATLSTLLTDGASYIVEVGGKDARGQEAQTAQRMVRVTFVSPPPAEIHYLYDPDVNSVTLTLLNPTSDQGVPAVYNMIEWSTDGKRWFLLYDDVDTNATLKDPTPPLNRNVTYRVTSYSHLGTEATSYVEVYTENPGDWWYLNSGPNYEDYCRFRLETRTGFSVDQNVIYHTFAGQRNPTPFQGTARTLSRQIQGVLENDDPMGNPWAFVEVLEKGPSLIYRDPLGNRMFCSLKEVDFPSEGIDVTTFRGTLMEVRNFETD